MNYCVEVLKSGVAIEFSGNGFDAVTVTKDGNFVSRPSEYSGWYTQKNNHLIPVGVVTEAIAAGDVRVVSTAVGGVLQFTHRLELVEK